MNSSTTTTNSESNLLTNVSPSQSIVKVKSSNNKENKLQRFGGAVVSGGTLVFGKIKSLWSINGMGLNMLADSDRRQKNNSKSKEHLGFCLSLFIRFSFYYYFLFFLFLVHDFLFFMILYSFKSFLHFTSVALFLLFFFFFFFALLFCVFLHISFS